MQGKQTGQIDIFNHMIFESLIPKDHLLLQIDKVVSFDFVYDLSKDYYSNMGRNSYDPVLMFKICLLQYLYNLSDRGVESRIQTDVAFRWFLKLELKDKVPDYTTISHYRINRLGDEVFEEYFKSIVEQCIDQGLVKQKRYLVDTTNVDANANYPSAKKLVCQSYYRVMKELAKIDHVEADKYKKGFEREIEEENEKVRLEEEETKETRKVSIEVYCKIAKNYAEKIYSLYHEEIAKGKKLGQGFTTLWDVIRCYESGSSEKDRIISAVDPDARVAHKRRGVRKNGYKEHIIVDEDSEIILSSIETPFNVPDEKKLKDLVEKVKDDYNLKPEEISADKAYGSTDNRAYLKDEGITGNIKFYDISEKEYKKYELSRFEISEDLKSAVCPNGCRTEEITNLKGNKKISIKFAVKDCSNCPLRSKCLSENDLNRGKKRRTLIAPARYDAVIDAMKRNQSEEFKEAIDKRYIVERRFATLVRNHGLRVSRYLRLKGASIHIKMANIACNIIRMVKILTANGLLGEVMPQNG